jgi:hypothetical protein
MGNGYVPGHAELALRLLREDQGLRALFENRYHGSASPAPRLSTELEKV